MDLTLNVIVFEGGNPVNTQQELIHSSLVSKDTFIYHYKNHKILLLEYEVFDVVKN